MLDKLPGWLKRRAAPSARPERVPGLPRLGFLFNHDDIHQVRHTAPIIGELLRAGWLAPITVLTSTAGQEAVVRALVDPDLAGRVVFRRLSAGWAASFVDRAIRGLAPVKRIAVLARNRRVFAGLDALVVPETTSALLKSWFRLRQLRLIYLPHGAGDRSVGFRKVVRAFDFVLLSGTKVRDRMLAGGLVTEAGHAMVGYPKFDAVPAAPAARLFDNGRPTVFYNPHFDPYLSSWYRMGPAVLAWFAAQTGYNLIFAPHVMLHRRGFHPSVERLRLGRVGVAAEQYRGVAHMRIDTGSLACTDMTYTRQADIYLGDASSQVYEFLIEPRPCLFLNSHGAAWRGDANYAHWALGEVIDSVGDLPAALARAAAAPGRFGAAQRAATRETFDLTGVPSARRAADAIIGFMDDALPVVPRPA